ncbi:transposase family protein [Streptomyces sp. NPDC046925]|uniref:transposase family protein n=1 Tax=Streptomyces sp. NPDC046925 TaxID=3155375 RepID=UPI0033EC7760
MTTARQATCPGCGCLSGRVHGSYLRIPRDLPAAGKPVVVALRVRRFVCAEGSCPRRTRPALRARSRSGVFLDEAEPRGEVLQEFAAQGIGFLLGH